MQYIAFFFTHRDCEFAFARVSNQAKIIQTLITQTKIFLFLVLDSFLDDYKPAMMKLVKTKLGVHFEDFDIECFV